MAPPQPTPFTTVAVIGAGPAGLTAAYLLSKEGIRTRVLEADPELVGGIARTVQYRGYHFDIGGHRFFSKSREVEDLWTELLPDDMVDRRRSSLIYYRRKLFSYPLRASEALVKLGVLESILCVLSYEKARLFPVRDPTTFEDWVTNQFGSGCSGSLQDVHGEGVGDELQGDLRRRAAQRIKGLSLASSIANALWPRRTDGDRSKVIKTLVDSFRYPRRGPGMLWERCAARVRVLGGEVVMGQQVVGCSYDATLRQWTVTHLDGAGRRQTTVPEHVISSTPLRELANGIRPSLSPAAVTGALRLRYRDFLTVVLILEDRNAFEDNWIYIHDPSVRVGRIQNFKSWSPEMVPDPTMCCYGLEYFCFEGDGLWEMRDEDLVRLGTRELERLGLAAAGDVIDGCVVRQPKAYPVYDEEYAANVDVLRRELEERFPTLHLVGRNGMHKYNNQDHAMITAMLCVRNIVAGARIYDVWKVNQDAEYHEARVVETREREAYLASGLRDVPTRATRPRAPRPRTTAPPTSSLSGSPD